MIAWALLGSLCAQAGGLQVAPHTAQELRDVLRGLSDWHPDRAICVEQCATLATLEMRGTLAQRRLALTIAGTVTSTTAAWVPLFGASHSLDFSAATVDGKNVPIFWAQDAYAVSLPPGPFVLRATLMAPRGGAWSVHVDGPIGEVSLAIPDADVVGVGKRRGVRDATYHVAPRASEGAAAPPPTTRRRLAIGRTFDLGRERRFEVNAAAHGVTPGEVISLPLLAGEQLDEFDARQAHVAGTGADRHLDWVADEAEPTLRYAGKWTSPGIALRAPTGAVKETWEVRCDDPYQCNFAGDAEPQVGATGHVWQPLAGQTLQVGLEELRPEPGVTTVAEEVTLKSEPAGQTLRQSLQVAWRATSGSAVSLELPKDARIDRLELDGSALPILRDQHGALQIGLPQANSSLHVSWQVPGRGEGPLGFSLLRPPMPKLSAPVGTIFHQVVLAPGAAAVATGGMAGAPRIALWPSLWASVLLAAGTAWALRRADARLRRPWSYLVASAGYALLSPAASLPLAATLGLSAFMGRNRSAKKRRTIAIDLLVWTLLVLASLAATVATLQQALFDPNPIDVTSLVMAPQDNPDPTHLTWGAFIAGQLDPTVPLPAPFVWCVPVFGLQLLWAAWALGLARFVVGEGPHLLTQLQAYWRAATARAA